MNRRCIALLTALTIVPLSSAKRLPPPNVKPVLSGGIEYSAHGDGTHAWVAATDVATRKELWRAKVFRIHTHWWKGEEDNQWVYISDLKLEPDALFIKDERKRCYSLDLTTRHPEARTLPLTFPFTPSIECSPCCGHHKLRNVRINLCASFFTLERLGRCREFR